MVQHRPAPRRDRLSSSYGTEVVVSSRWSLERDDKERPVAILETNNDITDRKRREKQIQRLNDELARRSTELARRSTELAGTNKELEAFAYSVSHDLRAPLRHMSGFTQLLHKRVSSVLDEKGQHYIMMILDSSKRMGTLIDDLLAFSRIGRAETQNTLVNLEQLVKEAVNEVRQETAGRNISSNSQLYSRSRPLRPLLKSEFQPEQDRPNLSALLSRIGSYNTFDDTGELVRVLPNRGRAV